MTLSRLAALAAALDDILDTALPGDDAAALDLVRLASRRIHDRIERMQRDEQGRELRETGT